MSRPPAPLHRRPVLPPRARSQAGMVMIFTLIALVLMLLVGAALLRTLDTSSILVNNLAFRRDLTNRAETAIAEAKAEFSTGASLGTETLRQADLASAHYYASKQAVSANGVPSMLLNTSTYDSTFGSPSGSDSASGVTLRWVIDRQCVAAGAFDSGSCENAVSGGDKNGTSWLRKPGGSTQPTYRISVRVSGPRGTEAFFQTTYSD